MIFAVIATLVIVSPVAGYIATYKYLYGHLPCEPINNLNKVGLEQDTVGVEENNVEVHNIVFEFEEVDTTIEQDNNIVFFNNNIRVQQNNIGLE